MHPLLAVLRGGMVEDGLVDEELVIASPGVGHDESTVACRENNLTGVRHYCLVCADRPGQVGDARGPSVDAVCCFSLAGCEL